MKFYLMVLGIVFSSAAIRAEDQPTLAPTSETQSVLVNQPAQPADQAVPQKCCNLTDKKIIYKNKRNVAPCAVQQGLNLSYCETSVDACCNKVSHLESFDVPACVPPCACKENVKVLRNGKKVVHDYGRYEVVVKALDDETIEVNYRKRLFNR